MPNRKLEWRETARADLLSIMDYISDDNPDAALKLKDDLDTRIETLLDRPKLYQAGRVAGTREMSMRRRYIVVYKEDETQVTILRVLHAAQQWPH